MERFGIYRIPVEVASARTADAFELGSRKKGTADMLGEAAVVLSVHGWTSYAFYSIFAQFKISRT